MQESIGPYTIINELGRGGMGVVYLAQDSKLDRLVAIKSMPAELAQDPVRLQRFEREARTLASLNHPNIAGIHGFEEVDGQGYLILEYVDGETLGEQIDRGPLSIQDALDIGIQISRGIEAAHEAGIIHRDLKPENIKMSSKGVVKVLDFGIARVDEGKSSAGSGFDGSTVPENSPTIAGAVIGTAAYMSPEQARGRRVDSRTDIWSLGVILYEMLVGVNLFQGESVSDSIAAVLNKDIELDKLPNDPSGTLSRVVRRCLERDVHRRLHHIADVRIELEECDESAHASMQKYDSNVECMMRISGETCKSLVRDGFDPLLLGWDMQYADNARESSTLILWIPSFGADHTSPAYRHLMDACPYRMIVPTPIGMEPGASIRLTISIENQLILYRKLASSLRASLRPSRVLIGGSSCGSIMALRTASGDSSGRLFDGVLAIDPDIVIEDCFMTMLFAEIDPDSDCDTMAAINKLSSVCETLFEWVTMHEHLIQCIDKMQDDITPLVRQAQSFTAPYHEICSAKDSPIIPWVRDACEHVRVLRCMFPNNQAKLKLVSEIRMLHLDLGCLGSKFEDDTMGFSQESSHSKMLQISHMLSCIDEVINLL